jgi:hypothetical protein
MCSTTKTQNLPLNVPGGSMPMANAPPVGPDANGASIPSGPSMPGGDQLGQTLDASKGPTSVPVTSDTGTGSFLNNLAIGAGVTPDNSNTGTHGPLTRFGMLTRVLAPLAGREEKVPRVADLTRRTIISRISASCRCNCKSCA